MKRFFAILAVVCLASSASAGDAVVSIVATSDGFLVAQGERATIELADRDGQALWSTPGVDHPTKIVVADDGKRAAVLDPLNNQLRIVDLGTHTSTLVRTGETPVDAAFLGDALFVLDRDARLVERVTIGGAKAALQVPVDTIFLRAAGDRLYVYSRGDGVLVEIGTAPFATLRTATVRPHASDCIVARGNAYLLYPHDAQIARVSLASMTVEGQVNAGNMPMAIAVVSGPTALSALTFAVADPAAKRVWTIEAPQSTKAAVGHGFLAGVLGVGVFKGRASEFPTGVDRVAIAGSSSIAYDTSSGTLYRFTKKESSVLMKDVPPNAWAVSPTGVAVWAGGRLQMVK
ncbi:MAG TPA: hypothetical protein VEZ11_05130 [Thermoanaerobaculia bacterium]|nr:hypothetical protein [Thermoanaerobaculia bacterium]